ncbi:MAG: PIN domain-containing protein [Actinomycetota bacterium]
MLIVDTSGLVAFFDSSDRHHAEVALAIDADPGPFVVSPYVIAELDYLLASRRGVAAEVAAIRELSRGAWELPSVDADDLAQVAGVIERYRDQSIGAADASLVVLAERYRTTRLLTLDHRHFRIVRSSAGDSFTLLP